MQEFREGQTGLTVQWFEQVAHVQRLPFLQRSQVRLQPCGPLWILKFLKVNIFFIHTN